MMRARSISRSVQTRLDQQPFTAHVLAVFDHSCDLATLEGHVLALVTPQVGDGPLNIVIEGESGDFASVKADMPATLDQHHLRVGGVDVVLSEAAKWEPCPHWWTLRTRHEAIASNMPLLREAVLRHAPAESWLAFVSDQARSTPLPGALDVASQAADDLLAGWQGDLDRLESTAARLAGLGTGLTPAGDDFLVGVMLWAWLMHPAPRVFGRALAAIAAPRTTILSAALLRAASEGECNAAWHRLLAILGTGAKGDFTPAVLDVMAHGATSGADTLAGFLWMEFARN